MTLLSRLRAAVGAGSDRLTGDWDLMPEPPPPADALVPAAVLMAVTDAARPQLLLTRRTSHLRRHAGQVAFPGGRIDPDDVTPVAAALREAEEEVALPPAIVDVLGTVDRYRTGTGFLVTPVVGIIPPGLVYVPHPYEVDEVFEVPLDEALDPANHQRMTGEWQGQERHYWVIGEGRRQIWGATAGMIVALSRRLA